MIFLKGTLLRLKENHAVTIKIKAVEPMNKRGIKYLYNIEWSGSYKFSNWYEDKEIENMFERIPPNSIRFIEKI